MNIMQMMSQFNRFKNNSNVDPEAKVKDLLTTGQMSQQQFEQFKAMAEQIEQMTKTIQNVRF